MTIPNHYLRRNLKKLIGKDKYHLYHWCSLQRAQSIINDGYLLSKAMLFGLHFHSNRSLVNSLKPHDVKSEAKNGFLDCVFLGNTDWSETDGKSFYGEVGFVLRPEKILPTREFFVYGFNTGRFFHTKPDIEKSCDLSILIDALEKKHRRYEILVRRRVKVNESNISNILCPTSLVENLSTFISAKHLNIPITPIRDSIMNDESIEITDPVDENKNKIILTHKDFIRESDKYFVKTKFSNCVLELHRNISDELIEVETQAVIGKVISKNPSPDQTDHFIKKSR